MNCTHITRDSDYKKQWKEGLEESEGTPLHGNVDVKANCATEDCVVVVRGMLTHFSIQYKLKLYFHPVSPYMVNTSCCGHGFEVMLNFLQL